MYQETPFCLTWRPSFLNQNLIKTGAILETGAISLSTRHVRNVDVDGWCGPPSLRMWDSRHFHSLVYFYLVLSFAFDFPSFELSLPLGGFYPPNTRLPLSSPDACGWVSECEVWHMPTGWLTQLVPGVGAAGSAGPLRAPLPPASAAAANVSTRVVTVAVLRTNVGCS